MSNIKFLVMDVDGTLTDGKIYMGNEGEVFKTFDIKDGYAIHSILKEYDITPVIITGRESKIVETRARELGVIDIYQGIADKKKKLEYILREKSELFNKEFTLSNVAYIGDDLNDIPVMLAIKSSNGIVGAPLDAINKVKDISDFISKREGGKGAVREFIEYIIDEIEM